MKFHSMTNFTPASFLDRQMTRQRRRALPLVVSNRTNFSGSSFGLAMLRRAPDSDTSVTVHDWGASLAAIILAGQRNGLRACLRRSALPRNDPTAPMISPQLSELVRAGHHG